MVDFKAIKTKFDAKLNRTANRYASAISKAAANKKHARTAHKKTLAPAEKYKKLRNREYDKTFL